MTDQLFSMNKLFILVIVALLPHFVSKAQTEEATTKSGKKVILYQDGTWKYADETVKRPEEKTKEPVKEKKAVITTTGVSADCEAMLEITDDSKTGLRITKTKNMIIVAETGGNNQLGIVVQKNSKGIITLGLRPVGAGECIEEGNKVNIVFTDGSKTELAHDGFANCNGESSVSFGGSFGKKKQFDQLRSKKIKTIKVWTRQGSVQQNLSDENQATLLKLLNCFTL